MITARHPVLRPSVLFAAIAAAFVSSTTFAASPITPPFAIQDVDAAFQIASARGADGSYVAVWSDQPLFVEGVPRASARVYRRDGSAFGPTFAVSAPGDRVERSAAAIAPDGTVVIAWGRRAAGSRGYVYNARRFSPTGTPLGPVIVVSTNADPESSNSGVSIAMDRDGDFVVAWESSFVVNIVPALGYFSQYLFFDSTRARRYAADGTPRGREIVVNRELPRLAFNQTTPRTPAVAMDGDGDFVVVRTSNHRDDQAVFAHRYRADGSSDGAPLRVSATEALPGNFGIGATMADDRSFTVAYGTAATNSNTTLNLRQYSAAGAARGPAIEVVTAQISFAAISGDALGNVVTAWSSLVFDGETALGRRVSAQAFAASGARRGTVFNVAPNSQDAQDRPSVASDPLGNFAITWLNTRPDAAEPGYRVSINSQFFASP